MEEPIPEVTMAMSVTTEEEEEMSMSVVMMMMMMLLLMYIMSMTCGRQGPGYEAEIVIGDAACHPCSSFASSSS
jgi:hypothetical protein